MKNGDTTLNLKTIAATAAALFITCGLMSEPAQAQTPDVWTYDFEDETGEFTSGSETNPSLLPSTQSDGGNTYLRIGDENKIELSKEDNKIGTFSRMIIEGSEAGARNVFAVGEFDNQSDLFYFRMSFKLVGEGQSGNISLHFDKEGRFGSDALALTEAFNLLRWNFGDDGNIETERRTAGGNSSTAGGLDEEFDRNQEYTVEFYFNNSTGQKSYYRDGVKYDLNEQKWDLWTDETKFDSNIDIQQSDGNIEPEDKIGAFRFFAGRNDENDDIKIEIDDIVYANHLPVYREIEGDSEEDNSGWRMLAAPTDGLDPTTLVRQNQVQGVSGDDFFGGEPNLKRFYHDEAENTVDWTVPEDGEDVLESGEGFIWYLFDNDDFLPSKPLPMGLVSKGDVPDDDVTVTLHREEVADGDSEGDSKWNLIGNPFGTDLDVSNIGNWPKDDKQLESSVGQIWDYDKGDNGSYRTTTDYDDKVAAFQGFFIQNEDAEQLEIPTDAQTAGATFFRETEDDTRLISLKMTGINENSGAELADHAANVYFHPEAETGWDLWSASKLTPLSASHISLGFLGERDGNERVLAQSSLPFDLDEEITIPLTISGTPDVSGSFEIDIESIRNIPDEWEMTASNTTSGSSYDLRSENPVIELNGNQQARSWQSPVSEDPLTLAASETEEESDEWVLTINPQDVTSSEPGRDVPQELTLEQNYPNPFNPVTTISYALPEDAQIELTVYDAMGRRITTLVDDRVSAGQHEVSWDASNAASGTYLYRLEVDGQIKTNTMTLVK